MQLWMRRRRSWSVFRRRAGRRAPRFARAVFLRCDPDTARIDWVWRDLPRAGKCGRQRLSASHVRVLVFGSSIKRCLFRSIPQAAFGPAPRCRPGWGRATAANRLQDPESGSRRWQIGWRRLSRSRPREKERTTWK